MRSPRTSCKQSLTDRGPDVQWFVIGCLAVYWLGLIVWAGASYYDADEVRALARYERQRRAFEDLFE